MFQKLTAFVFTKSRSRDQVILSCNLQSRSPSSLLFGKGAEKDAWYMYIYSTCILPIVQDLDFSPIGQKTTAFGVLHWLVTINISDFRCNQIDLTFISLWQKPLRWSRNSTRLSYEKKNTILANQVNNVHRKTLSNDDDDEDSCYLLPIRISAISFLLGPGRI